jgi:cell division protein FtsN
MADFRPRADLQLRITHGHLAALGVTTASVAVLAFLVGVQVGRRAAPVAEEAPAAAEDALLPDGQEAEALARLLREVELSQGSFDPTGAPALTRTTLTFPSVLGEQTTAAPAKGGAGNASVAVAAPAGEPPRAPSMAPPVSGWAIQVGSYPTQAEAEARIAELTGHGVSAYRVAALVDGQTWHRVRVGGFSDRDRAESARAALATNLDEPDLLLAEAP